MAAISIISYVGLQQRARESRVALQLTQLRKEMEMYKTVHGEWPFQDSMDAYIADPKANFSAASAWCHAARGYIEDANADSDAFGDENIWGVTCVTRTPYEWRCNCWMEILCWYYSGAGLGTESKNPLHIE